MSFHFPKQVLDESKTSVLKFVYNLINHKLVHNRERDYDELIILLSFFTFNRLSPSDQRGQVEYVRCIVKSEAVEEQRPEESDEAFRLRSFSELFKKLTFSYQLKLLDRFFKKLKRARQLGELISSFKQLDAEQQQQLIENCVVEVPPENLRNPGEPDDDFRLRRFTELSTYYTAHVYKRFLAWKNAKKSADEQEETSDDETNSDWKSSFFEFFLGFSIIWFQGQSASGQDVLIEQLLLGVGGGVVIQNRLQDESAEDFKLRRFTELCKQVVDFRVQTKFLDNARSKLETWGTGHFSFRSVLEPQEYDRAAEIHSDLSTLGFGLLSAKYQQQKIDEMSNQVEGRMIKDLLKERHELSEEAIRVRRFRELFNQVPVRTRIDLFEEMRRVLLKLKSYSEAIHFFSGLRSEDQTEMIEKLMHEIRNSAELIIEKLSGESEEDFRLRRFTKVCAKHLSTRNYIAWPEVDTEPVGQGTSDNEEESLYAKFLFDVSVTWFKARCANYRRNPLHVILFGKVEFRDVIEKLPEESEEDFRLRRFTESFKRLEFTYKDTVVDYIQDTLFGDLGHPVSYIQAQGPSLQPEGRSPFDIEWTNVKLSKLQGLTAAGGASAAGTGATTQAGGGRGVGTSQ